ncbi:hypothetical protein FB45DRAFT_871796 [Roridomyces roridus]|uniref:Uncharacterized protein n=1 Tax=Roridomyces roridus TaxID=1738132 RepID=A0AAD7BFU5_9AGAR|nr:hypothetical protein FB45DRAFT_871796 [Roridomyces roridus]
MTDGLTPKHVGVVDTCSTNGIHQLNKFLTVVRLSAVRTLVRVQFGGSRRYGYRSGPTTYGRTSGGYTIKGEVGYDFTKISRVMDQCWSHGSTGPPRGIMAWHTGHSVVGLKRNPRATTKRSGKAHDFSWQRHGPLQEDFVATSNEDYATQEKNNGMRKCHKGCGIHARQPSEAAKRTTSAGSDTGQGETASEVQRTERGEPRKRPKKEESCHPVTEGKKPGPSEEWNGESGRQVHGTAPQRVMWRGKSKIVEGKEVDSRMQLPG